MRRCFHIQVGLLTAAHALEEVADMSLHHISLLNRYLDFFLAEFVIREWVPAFLPLSANQLRAHKNVWSATLEHPMLNHDNRAFVPSDQSRNVLGIRHR